MGTHPIFESDFDCLTEMSYGTNQGPSHLQQTQDQVREVVGIMRGNVEKVLERDQKLSQLDDRADALQAGARLKIILFLGPRRGLSILVRAAERPYKRPLRRLPL